MQRQSNGNYKKTKEIQKITEKKKTYHFSDVCKIFKNLAYIQSEFHILNNFLKILLLY